MQKENVLQRELPYERFLDHGPEHLTEAELLAIILRTGTRNKTALDLAKEVLSLAKYPKEGLLGLHHVSLEELQQIPGIGQVKAVKLKCLTELCARMSRAKVSEGISFTNSSHVADYFMEQLRHKSTEAVYLLGLDNKGKLIGEKRISEGSVRMALISPREIFLEAFRMNAVNLILVHNHPSGDPQPSISDKQLTDAVKQAGEWMDIPLLDHVIIGEHKYYSFKEAGLL